MGRALLEAANPPMWRIEESRGPSASRFVRFGAEQVRISDIAFMSLEEVRSSPSGGLFLNGTVFLCVAALLAYYVYEVGGRERFLIGAAFLGMLGIAAVSEALRLRGLRHYEMELVLKDGRRIVFTSADRADIQALALRLAAEGAPQA